MRTFSERIILNKDGADRSEARCGVLNDLRETVVSRSSELRALTDKKARQMKHKSLVDLLKGLHASGLSFNATAVDRRQATIAELFSVGTTPQFEVLAAFTGELGDGNAFSSSTTLSKSGHVVSGGEIAPSGGPAALAERWKYEWSRSEELYYRCVFRLTQVRHSRTAHHHDLSSREVQKALGLVEHGFTILLHEREAISGAIDQCASLQALLGQLTHLVDQHTSTSSPKLPPDHPLPAEASCRASPARERPLRSGAPP